MKITLGMRMKITFISNIMIHLCLISNGISNCWNLNGLDYILSVFI